MVVTNSHGMRSPEPVSRREGTYRIAVVGDSYTFGFGVDLTYTYPQQLQAELNRRRSGTRFEVLNYGVGGYSARDEALVVKHKVIPMDPDLLIVGYNLNDPEITPLQPAHARYQTVEWWQYSHLLRLVAKTEHRIEIMRFGGGNYYRALHAHPEKWQSVLDAFDSIASSVRRTSIEAVLVIFPITPTTNWGRYRYEALHRQVASAARAAGFHVVDLLDEFRKRTPGTLRLSKSDDHPTKSAHRIVALEIYEELDGLSVLPVAHEKAGPARRASGERPPGGSRGPESRNGPIH